MTYYAKLQDGRLIYAPKKIKNGSTITYNPGADVLIACGYKLLRIVDMPPAKEGYHYEPLYIEKEEEIVQSWQLVEDEHPAPDEHEQIEELTATVAELREKNAFLEDCILEMSEIVYA